MMRVLLINPAMNLKKLGRFAGLLEPMPCIGLAYIAGALEEHGCLVHVVDMFAEKLSGDQVVQRARDFQNCLFGCGIHRHATSQSLLCNRYKDRYCQPSL